MNDLNETILSNPVNSRVFSGGWKIFLVGGFIRDIIARGIQSKDLDYAVKRGELRTVVNNVSRILRGRVVELRRERILRVVLKNGTNLDFGLLQGDIHDDLRCRDFTVNAMAWSPETGLLDPVSGLDDINNGVIRGISRKNFQDDPLRLLRAYRFLGENSWRIERKTRRILKEMHSNISKSASERITLEFFKLLNSEGASIALGTALRDGILRDIIPLSFNRLGKNIKLVSKFDEKPEKMNEIVWFKEFSQGLSLRGLLRLECLMLGANFKKVLRLRFSRKIQRNLVSVSKSYDDLKGFGYNDRGKIFDALSEAGPAALDLLLLTNIVRPMEEYRMFKGILERGIITTDEIMKKAGLGPGRKLGRAINQIRRMQFEGKISKKSDALKWLKSEFGDSI
jgi:tRNA nucleotidyltransferase (CCA-adding enzyme)